MDLVTQGLLGSAVAQAAYSRKIGRKTALYGFLIGLIPDFDIIAGFWGEWASLKYHRGPTHSLPLLMVASIPLGYLFKKMTGSQASSKDWIGMTFLALFTHPLIDWCTTYGTPLFWPFSNARLANDALPIIDPLYSLPLLIVFFIGLFNLLSPGKRKALAALALAVSTIYAFWGYRNSQYLVREGFKIFSAQGFEPVEVRATPTMFNNRLFRVVARDQKRNFMITYMKIGNGSTLSPIQKATPSDDELVQKAMNHETGKLFTWFAMDMICPTLERADDGTSTVVLNDMRYGFISDPQKSLFAAEARFDVNGNLIGFSRRRGRGSINFKDELKRIMEEFF